MTLIEVKPNFDTLVWVVCIDGVEVGRHESSLECDVWAHHIAKAYIDATINKYREERWILLDRMYNARKEKAKANKAVGSTSQGASQTPQS